MKAAILVKNRSPLIIADIEPPQSLEYGQVLVKIFYSGICGTQLNEIEGVKGEDKFLPHLLGHEGSGIVEKCGPGVTTVKKGDHVVLHWRKGEGINSNTPLYKWRGKTVNAGWVTTFNEYAVVSENRVTPIPKDYDLVKATLFGCAMSTAFGVIHNNAKMHCGESLAVFGSGGVGSAIIIAASVAGIYPIIAVDINDYKLKMAKKLGASHTLNAEKDNIKEKIRSIVSDGIDVAVDTTGINKIRELSFELTAPSGRTILVGVPKKGEKMSIDSFPLHFGKILTGSHGGNGNPSYEIKRLLRLEKSGKYDLSIMITHIFPLEKINEALGVVRHGDTIRCIIKM